MNNRNRVIILCACGSLVFAGCDKTPAPKSGTAAETVQAGGRVVELNDMNFAAQTSQGVVLVDFWAPWCPPCREQGPIVDAVAKQLGDTAKVVKVNVDEAPQTAQAFGIRSIPTLVVLKDGKQVKQFVGLTQADELVAAVKGSL
jgi:thioredoxin 1